MLKNKIKVRSDKYSLPGNLNTIIYKNESNEKKTLQLYEPAMCCSTGLCGVGINEELLRISTVLDNLKKNGIEVERYNLSNFPMKFITNQEVNNALKQKGDKALPITLVNQTIVLIGRYPTNEELAKFLGISKSLLRASDKEGCC